MFFLNLNLNTRLAYLWSWEFTSEFYTRAVFFSWLQWMGAWASSIWVLFSVFFSYANAPCFRSAPRFAPVKVPLMILKWAIPLFFLS